VIRAIRLVRGSVDEAFEDAASMSGVSGIG
jgi:hypothetical protein